MENLFATLILAFVVFLVAMAVLGIGWLLTGKAKIRSCGGNPYRKRDDSCGKDISCPMCTPEEKSKCKHDEKPK